MESNNPYAPPKSPVEAGLRDSAPTAPSVPLYSTAQITVATFFASAFAGAWLGAANFRAIGQPLLANRTLRWGLGLAIVTMGLGFLLPDKLPNYILPLAVTFAVRGVAIRHFDVVLAAHKKAGGELRSWWRVVGISLLVLAILLVVVFACVAGWALVYYLVTGKEPPT